MKIMVVSDPSAMLVIIQGMGLKSESRLTIQDKLITIMKKINPFSNNSGIGSFEYLDSYK